MTCDGHMIADCPRMAKVSNNRMANTNGLPVSGFSTTCQRKKRSEMTAVTMRIPNKTTTTVSAVLASLPKGATFYCRVRAVTVAGRGNFSSVIGPLTVQGLSTAPRDLALISGRDSSGLFVSASWNLPRRYRQTPSRVWVAGDRSGVCCSSWTASFITLSWWYHHDTILGQCRVMSKIPNFECTQLLIYKEFFRSDWFTQ
jgi:hypothetical protein